MGILLACLPHIGYQPMIVIATSALCLSWRVAVLFRWMRAPHNVIQLLIAAAALFLILQGESYNLGRDSGISLLIAALVIKQIQRHDESSFGFSVCLTYFVAAAAFLYNQSLFTFFCAGHAVVLVSLALYARLSDVQITATPNYHSVARLLAYATPLTLLLFFLIPDFKGPLWEVPNDAFEAQSGLSDQMSPGKISALMDNNDVVFRVKFKPMPADRDAFVQSLYWRGPVFTYFDGQTWQSLGDKPAASPEVRNAALYPGILNRPAGFIKTARHQGDYKVILEPHFNNWLFTLQTPAQVPEDFYVTVDDELFSRYVVNQPLQYTLPLTSAGSVIHALPDKNRYLRLPNLYGRKTKALVERLRDELNSAAPYDTQMVTKVLDYLRDNPFYYSKKPPLIKYDPVDEFMLKTKTGFCEHYASAFAFMMRAAGIPARVVTGYLGGEYNTIGNYIVVRQSDAHAWTEVWLRGTGWVKVDPTAVLPPDRVDTTDSNSNAFLMAGLILWDNATVHKIQAWLDNLSFHWYAFLANVLEARNQTWLSWLLRSKTYLLVVLLLWLCTLLARRYWLDSRHGDDSVVQTYEKFCRKLSHRGFARMPHESASDFAARIGQHQPQWQDTVETITAFYNQLRYAKNPRQDAYKKFKSAIACFRP